MPRHALQLLQSDLPLAQVDWVLHEEGRGHLPGRAGELPVLGDLVLGHGPGGDRPRRPPAARGPERGAPDPRRRALSRRWDGVPGESPGGDPDGHRPAARRWVADDLLEAPPPRLVRFSRPRRGRRASAGAGRRRRRRADRPRGRRVPSCRRRGSGRSPQGPAADRRPDRPRRAGGVPAGQATRQRRSHDRLPEEDGAGVRRARAPGTRRPAV